MVWLSTILLVTLITIASYYYYKYTYTYWKSKGVPYRTPVPLFGNGYSLISGILPPGEYFRKLYNNTKEPYIGFYVLHKPFLLLNDPEIIKRVLIKDFRVFPNRMFFSDVRIDPIASNSLLGIKTPKWKPLRSKLSPMFSSGKIRMMVDLMKECGENLEIFIESCLNQDVDVKEIAARYTTDVIASCAFGINANCMANQNNGFRVAGKKLFERSFFRSIAAVCYFIAPELIQLFKVKFMDQEATDYLREIFTNTVHQRKNGNYKRNDLIDILMELEKQESRDDDFKFDDNILVAQVVFFFGAGFETTSSTIAYTLHELCFNSNVQEILRKEIKETIEKHGNLTYECVQDMKYLHMTISETLRKYPLTAFLSRVCEEDYKIDKTGLVIEKGTPVIIPIPGIHWDPKYFSNPSKYDPERFSDDNKENISAYTYLPFGDGPRNCIGERFGLLSTKLGLIHILRKYKIVRASTSKENLVFSTAGLLQAKGGVHLQFVAI